MPTYTLSAPDGNTYSVNGPEGATQAQVQAEVLRQNPTAGTPKQAAAQAQPSASDALIKGAKNLYGSYLEPAAAMASGAVGKVAGDVAGLGAIPANFMGLTNKDPADVQQGVQNALTYQPRTDAGKATTGLIGSIADHTIGALGRGTGQMYGGAAKMLGAGDDLSGAIERGTGEAVKQGVGLMGLRGELPAADLAPAAKVSSSLSAETAQTLKNGREAGLLMTPTNAGDTSTIGNLASMSGSETKMQQAVSRFNSGAKGPEIAAKDIGIEDGDLTPKAIASQKAKASAVYDQAKKAPDAVPDPELVKDMKSIGVRNAAVDKQFGSDISPDIQKLQDKYSPKVADGTTPGEYQPINMEALVESVKSLRADAKKLYTKGQQDPEAARMSDATQRTADAMDDFMYRSLVKNGQPNLAKEFLAQRTNLAKIKSVEDAYNPYTGSIDASSLAHDLDRGVPLSGGLRTLAESYKAFPKSFQLPERLPNGGPTILEQGGLVGSLMHGNIPLALASVSRPVARQLAMRPAFQNRMAGIAPPPPGPPGLGAQASSPVANALATLGQQNQNGPPQ